MSIILLVETKLIPGVVKKLGYLLHGAQDLTGNHYTIHVEVVSFVLFFNAYLWQSCRFWR